MATVLLIDAMIQVYANYNAMGHLKTSKGESTGLRYGFLRSVRAQANRFEANRVVVCWDTGVRIQKAVAAGQTETYKSDRENTPAKQAMFDQIPDLKEMIGLTNWTQVQADGFEADDIIGALTRRLSSQGHTIVIVTSDNDMTQLLDPPSVRIWVPNKQGKVDPHERTLDSTLDKFGVPPCNLLFWRCLAGDESDHVLGAGLLPSQLERIGTLLRSGTTDIQDLILRIVEGAEYHLRPEQKAQFYSNLKLMSLIDPGEQLQITKGAKDRIKLDRLFTQLEFKSMMKFAGELTQ